MVPRLRRSKPQARQPGANRTFSVAVNHSLAKRQKFAKAQRVRMVPCHSEQREESVSLLYNRSFS